MVNLKEIQEALSKNPEEFKKFQNDPVAYLEAKGLFLHEEAKTQLANNVKTQDASKAVWNVGVQLGPQN